MSQSDANDERIAAPHPFVPPLLAQLRDGTRAAHDRIEAIPGLGILLDPALSAGAYITALKALYAFQAGMYRKLPPLLVNITGLRWPDPDVLQSLTDDLTWFGVALPRPVAGPRTLRTSNSALGTLYPIAGGVAAWRPCDRPIRFALAWGYARPRRLFFLWQNCGYGPAALAGVLHCSGPGRGHARYCRL